MAGIEEDQQHLLEKSLQIWKKLEIAKRWHGILSNGTINLLLHSTLTFRICDQGEDDRLDIRDSRLRSSIKETAAQIPAGTSFHLRLPQRSGLNQILYLREF